MKSFSDKPVFNIPMYEIDVRKLHNDLLGQLDLTLVYGMLQ